MAETEKIESCTIQVTQFIEQDGSLSYVVRQRGAEVPLSTQLGLLELAKMTLAGIEHK